MKEALKKVFMEDLIAFKKTKESSSEMLLRRKRLMDLMDYIHENFILDDIPAKAMEAKHALKSIAFNKELAVEVMDDLECLMNKLY
ncbi:MAG: hypothetical protein IKF52_01970 [Clostridia bacterium]|nr:hypothetical protein [Clostridia bacterium]